VLAHAAACTGIICFLTFLTLSGLPDIHEHHLEPCSVTQPGVRSETLIDSFRTTLCLYSVIPLEERPRDQDKRYSINFVSGRSAGPCTSFPAKKMKPPLAFFSNNDGWQK